jgi:hypothetical protein
MKMLPVYTIEWHQKQVVCKRQDVIVSDPSEIIGPVEIRVRYLRDAALPFSLTELDVRILQFDGCTVDLSCVNIPRTVPVVALNGCIITGNFDTNMRVSALYVDNNSFIADVEGFNRTMNVDLFETRGDKNMNAIPYSTRIVSPGSGFYLDHVRLILDGCPTCRVIRIHAFSVSLQNLIAFFDEYHEQLDLRYYLNDSAIGVHANIRDALSEYLRTTYQVTESLVMPSFHTIKNDVELLD